MQIIGLLRWVFVVPVLATEYVHTTDPATQQAIEIHLHKLSNQGS